MQLTDSDRRSLVNMAIGRVFRLASRPTQPGDAAEYERCRSLVLELAGEEYSRSLPELPLAPVVLRGRAD